MALFVDCGLHSPPSQLQPRSFLHRESSYRFLQMVAGQLAILGVVVENRAQLKMCPGFDSLWRLKLKHRL